MPKHVHSSDQGAEGSSTLPERCTVGPTEAGVLSDPACAQFIRKCARERNPRAVRENPTHEVRAKLFAPRQPVLHASGLASRSRSREMRPGAEAGGR